jgi:arabinan endo-1,5-alpha-L-arabinosidase
MREWPTLLSLVCFGLLLPSAFYAQASYTNPVVAESLPDPTIIKASDGFYYLYATEDIRNIPILRSTDLVDWAFCNTAFTDATRPTFEPNGGLWAPDINYIKGQYVLYYSMSVWGGEQTCGVGVATADSPVGPFTDHGKLFRSNEIGVQNSIDPFYMEDEGKKYLFWGSFSGIYGIELTEDGLSIKPNAEKVQIAGTAFEGAYIYKKEAYYYLFASIGACCNGISSTYRLVTGRSQTLLGGFKDKTGKSMLDNGYSVVIGSNERFVGNGHCSEIVRDDAGYDWIFYHGYDKNNPSGRHLFLSQIKWDEYGWPFVDNDSPSPSASAPAFGTNIEPPVVFDIKIRLDSALIDNRSNYPIEVIATTAFGRAFVPPADLSWNVSNTDICRIEDGVVKALKNGTTLIRGTLYGLKDSLIISVENPVTYRTPLSPLQFGDWTMAASSQLNAALNTNNLPANWQEGIAVNFTYAAGRAPYIRMTNPKAYTYGLPDTLKIILHTGEIAISKGTVYLKANNDTKTVSKEFTAFQRNNETELSIPVSEVLDVADRGIYPIRFDNIYFMLETSMTQAQAYTLALKTIDQVYAGMAPTGIVLPAANRFSVYPNPASDKVHVTGIRSDKPLLQLYAIDGILLKETTGTEMDINGFTPGTYILRVKAGQFVGSKPFIISR